MSAEWYSWWPALNATLNGCTAVLILVGYRYIRQRNITAHRYTMLTAFGVALLFLASYLAYHSIVGTTRFTGTGWIRPVYFFILISHTVLAAVVVPLAVLAVVFGLRDRRRAHRAVVRWLWPMWLYVSVTGVLIYFMLYHWYPQRP